MSLIPSFVFAVNMQATENTLQKINNNEMLELFDFLNTYSECHDVQEYIFQEKQLLKIKALYLSDYKLKGLPKGIVTLKNLEYLDLSHNEIEKLPKNFKKLKKLQYLFLNNNKLKYFPREIIKLKSLQSLDLSSNLMRMLPKNAKKKEYAKIVQKPSKSTSNPIAYIRVVPVSLSDSTKIFFKNIMKLPELKYLNIAENVCLKIPDFFTQHVVNRDIEFKK